MNRIAGLALAGAITTLSAGSAAAEGCDIRSISVVGGQISANYDSFSSGAQSVPVRLSSSLSGDCAGQRVSFRIEPLGGRSLAPDGSLILSNGADELIAQVRNENQSGSVSGRSLSAATTIQLDGAGGFSLGDLLLILRGGQKPAPGTYQAQIKLVVESARPHGGPAAVETIVTITVVVAPSVMLSASWGTDLDLGTIAANGQADKPLRFRAYANMPYEIVLTSDNAFGLRRSHRSGEGIAYIPIVDDTQLSQGAAREKQFARPSMSGFRDHRLNVVVPALAARAAGDYEDVITVSIRPAL